MAQSSEPPRIADIGTLAEPFRSDVLMLDQALRDEHLPMVLFETRRTLERQRWLFANGRTRVAGIDNSPHPNDRAVDYILDVDSVYWKVHHEKPIRTRDGGAAWDTGVEFNGKVCRIVRPVVAGVWKRYGAIAMGLGLRWGGDAFAEGWQSRRLGDPFGWDPAHVQMIGWRRHVAKMATRT